MSVQIKIQLKPHDGDAIEVDKEVAEKSQLIKNMLEDIGEETSEIPLPNVTSAILSKVIDYCQHHRNDPPLPPDDEASPYRSKNSYDIDEWDAEFCKMDQGTLFELILAANYLDIKPLLDVTCKTVANMIRGKSPEEIRKTFNIENDFTPEEEEQVRRENEWCEERN
eukprot:NODE_635_length_5742_cov_0.308701.p4 type:complete len:167 gc:universal NODE_635_length_5742_cov_0.308701:2442-1942(-)